MKPLLSIITPVYNVSNYLNRCVNSILSQSFRELELILVDDGSTDGSSLICDEWAIKDNRVVVIHQKNGGVSSARNIGLNIAKGEYLTFVDSDDFLASDTYKINMDFLLRHPNVDILQYPYCHYNNEQDITNFHCPSSMMLYGPEQIFVNWWSGTPLEYVIWNKIFRRSLWIDIHFSVGRTSEDTLLVAEFVKKANIVYISEKGLYYYQRFRKDSYTYVYDFDKHIDLFYAHAAIYECFMYFPAMVTEKVLAFTRLFRRLITAKQMNMEADVSEQLAFVSHNFPSWRDIIVSKKTEKLWLSVAKIAGVRLFTKLFLKYLSR